MFASVKQLELIHYVTVIEEEINSIKNSIDIQNTEYGSKRRERSQEDSILNESAINLGNEKSF